jgi:hypothetical protein
MIVQCPLQPMLVGLHMPLSGSLCPFAGFIARRLRLLLRGTCQLQEMRRKRHQLYQQLGARDERYAQCAGGRQVTRKLTRQRFGTATWRANAAPGITSAPTHNAHLPLQVERQQCARGGQACATQACAASHAPLKLVQAVRWRHQHTSPSNACQASENHLACRCPSDRVLSPWRAAAAG